MLKFQSLFLFLTTFDHCANRQCWRMNEVWGQKSHILNKNNYNYLRCSIRFLIGWSLGLTTAALFNYVSLYLPLSLLSLLPLFLSLSLVLTNNHHILSPSLLASVFDLSLGLLCFSKILVLLLEIWTSTFG